MQLPSSIDQAPAEVAPVTKIEIGTQTIEAVITESEWKVQTEQIVKMTVDMTVAQTIAPVKTLMDQVQDLQRQNQMSRLQALLWRQPLLKLLFSQQQWKGMKLFVVTPWILSPRLPLPSTQDILAQPWAKVFSSWIEHGKRKNDRTLAKLLFWQGLSVHLIRLDECSMHQSCMCTVSEIFLLYSVRWHVNLRWCVAPALRRRHFIPGTCDCVFSPSA